jgi:hypothetical protein
MIKKLLAKIPINVEKIEMDEKNRMLRAGGGLNDGRRFFRVDLWKVGYRFTKRKK